MKRLIYITYLGLLALLLISCEKDNVVPATAGNNPDDLAKKVTCVQYQYQNGSAVVNLGIAGNGFMLAGFNANVTTAQKQAILAQYPIFDQLDGEFPTESGPVTIIKLNGTGTCLEVEQMLMSLERKPQVKFAAPVFIYTGGVMSWIGPNNQVIVRLKNAASYPQLQHFTRKTRTTIVEHMFGLTYLIGTDKHSAGNSLEMSDLLNDEQFVDGADPDFIFQLPLVPGGNKAELQSSYEQMNLQAEV